ncbi:STAS domain-containing protein [Candidatus Sulfidibacterium hydrothermale]|uniref:STAS domain-containing protein n=1 Tax=Candidatus Sulfidibacterium hydrothermale TaxID=2875962 RepID=UPI001F0A8262|nr:STAS domain-containing protein [Candidatus Sulfidibacterium hydrothermale]UBM61862.1 STAS domain-containing protein [Candidatus Sulfidibacterium hydrothermale]
MVEINTSEDKNTIQIVFSDDLSVAKASEMHEQLRKFAWEAPTISILTKEVKNMDLSFLQLLFSFAREMKNSGKKLIFDFQFEEEMERIFEESGFQQAFEKI